MTLKETIYRRRSTRKFASAPLGDAVVADLLDFCKKAKPLYPNIKVEAKLVERSRVKSLMPWLPPQLIAVYSQKADGYLENAGFIFQQLDLYAQSLGLGCCWIGLGHMNKEEKHLPDAEDMEFVILLAVGTPKDHLRSGAADFKRKSLGEISDTPDPKLESARLAPSSVNSQPWYFTHDEDKIHVFCAKRGVRVKKLWSMNVIDMGIALAHLYVQNPETFTFAKHSVVPVPDETKGYIGTVTL